MRLNTSRKRPRTHESQRDPRIWVSEWLHTSTQSMVCDVAYMDRGLAARVRSGRGAILPLLSQVLLAGLRYRW